VWARHVARMDGRSRMAGTGKAASCGSGGGGGVAYEARGYKQGWANGRAGKTGKPKDQIEPKSRAILARPFQNASVVLGQNLGIISKISMRRIIINKSVYIQLLSITSVFFKTCLKYLLMNCDLQFCTIRGGIRLEVRQLAAILSVSDRSIANQLTEFFQSFCLKVDIPICSQSA